LHYLLNFVALGANYVKLIEDRPIVSCDWFRWPWMTANGTNTADVPFLW